jgi:hypothetical protein
MFNKPRWVVGRPSDPKGRECIMHLSKLTPGEGKQARGGDLKARVVTMVRHLISNHVPSVKAFDLTTKRLAQKDWAQFPVTRHLSTSHFFFTDVQ